MAGDWLEQMKSVQSLLGSSNDCRAVRSLVASLGGNREIEASLRKKQRRKTQEFRRLWAEKFASAGTARQWIQALRRPPRKPMARSVSAQAGRRALEA